MRLAASADQARLGHRPAHAPRIAGLHRRLRPDREPQALAERLDRDLRRLAAVRPEAPVKAGDAGRVGWAMSESRLIR